MWTSGNDMLSRLFTTNTKEVKLENIIRDDTIVALMGPTGTGKSTFIETATAQKGKSIGHALKSHTSEIRAVRYLHPDTLRPFVLVDTPGFNDTNRSDAEILAMIAHWLEKTYKRKVLLSGIVYLHRISDNRMSGSPLTNLHMFAKLCGDGAAKNVVLATTMWGNVKPEVGQRREDELKGKYWAGMLKLGSQAMRFKDSPASAWNIIDTAIKSEEDHTLLIQEELVDLRRRLSETEAGKALYKKLQKSLAEQKESIRKLRDQAQVEENEELAEELTAQYEAMQDILQTTFDQMSKMKIPLGRRLKMLTSFRKPRLTRPVCQPTRKIVSWADVTMDVESSREWRSARLWGDETSMTSGKTAFVES